MSIFSSIPWKAVAKMAPALFDILRQARGFAFTGDKDELAEVRQRISNLESEQQALFKGMKYLLAGVILVFLVSAASLVVGIIALTRY